MKTFNEHKCGCVSYFDRQADAYGYSEVCAEHWVAIHGVAKTEDAE